MSNIGKKIADRRKQLGLTLEYVGDAVGVSKTTVQRWEKGNIKSMKMDKISALANVLGMHSIDLIPVEASNTVRLEVKGSKPKKLFAVEASPKIKSVTPLDYGMQEAHEVKGVVVDKQFKQLAKLWKEATPESKRIAINVLKVGKEKK